MSVTVAEKICPKDSASTTENQHKHCKKCQFGHFKKVFKKTHWKAKQLPDVAGICIFKSIFPHLDDKLLKGILI